MLSEHSPPRLTPESLLLSNRMFLKPGLICKFLFIFSFIPAGLLHGQPVSEYTVVIDPGHGGYGSPRYDDKWDPVTGRYLEPYGSGMRYQQYEEHFVMMKLAREVRKRLELTSTEKGFSEFKKILNEFTDSENLPWISLKTVMTRNESWQERFKETDPGINDPYRLYDFPDRRNKKRIRMGRISYINSVSPHLAVSLHMTPAGRGHPGGMAAVLTPGYDTFDLIRRIHLDQEPVSSIEKSPWFKDSLWIISDSGWSKYESARADTWVYFHGFRSLRSGSGPWLLKNRGIRHNLITWNYRDTAGWEKLFRLNGPGPYSRDYREFQATGKFWDRERSAAERWKREGGPLGFGGDNHYATDELMRFLQFKMRNLNAENSSRYRKPGPIHPPYVSAYSLPNYVNAVTAYIETGFLNRETDRTYMTRDRAAMADALAAGIYSLFTGIKVRSKSFPFEPKGAPLNFSRYEQLPEGNYFRAAAVP